MHPADPRYWRTPKAKERHAAELADLDATADRAAEQHRADVALAATGTGRAAGAAAARVRHRRSS